MGEIGVESMEAEGSEIASSIAEEEWEGSSDSACWIWVGGFWGSVGAVSLLEWTDDVRVGFVIVDGAGIVAVDGCSFGRRSSEAMPVVNEIWRELARVEK